MDQWKEFESWHDRCAAWIKDSESRLRDADLKATLQDKQTQLEKLKVSIRLHSLGRVSHVAPG